MRARVNATHQSFRTRGRGLTLAGCVLAILSLVAGSSPAAAQFSGPALGISPQANTVQTATTDPTVLNPALQDLELAPGDLLAIRIFGFSDFLPVVRVSVDGTIQLPLIGVVPVAGLSIDRAEDLIAQRLVEAGMYVNPQVSIQVTEAAGQFATVSGEVHGIVPLTGNRRLLDVLAVAGPLPPTASHVITIIRPGVEKPIVVDLGTDPARTAANDIQILPRDTILVSRVGVVYVLGAFRAQGIIALQQTSPLTLIQVSALSGGAGFEGKFKDLRIIRTVGLERKLLRVDYKRIVNGQDPDPVLQADDIVYLPSDPFKAALKSGGIATASNLASVFLLAYQTLHY